MTKEDVKKEVIEEKDISKKKKKFCSNCGEKLEEGDKFCDSCGKEVKTRKKSSKSEEKKEDKVKTKKCPNCGASIKYFQTSCNYCKAEISNVKVSNALEEFTKGLEKIKSKEMPEYTGKESLLKKMIGKDFNEKDEREEFEENFREQKNEEIATYILNFPIPNSTEDITEFMILVASNVDSKTETNEDIQRAWKSKMNQIYEKAKLSVNDEEDLKKITEIYEKKTIEIKSKKITNALKVAAGIVGWFALLGFLINPIRTIIFLLINAGIILTIYSVLIDKNIISESPKLTVKTAKKLSYPCFVIAIILYIVSWILSNPLVSIGIILLLIAIILFIYYLLAEKNKIKTKFNLNKKVVYIICGALCLTSLILFIVNGVKNSDSNYDYDYDKIKESLKDNQNDKEPEKESSKVITDYSVDYKTAKDFEKAINDGKKVKRKIVLFKVNDYQPDSVLGINTWAGEHLNFISKEELDVKKGYYVLGKVTKEPEKVLRSWEIKYEVLEIYKKKPEIKEDEEGRNQYETENENDESDTNDNSKETKDEENENDELEDKDNVVIMIVPVEDYIGTDYKLLKEELESYGITNIVVESVKTEDSKYKNNTIKEFTINGKTYKPFDEFQKDDEFKIVYWEVKETKLPDILTIDNNKDMAEIMKITNQGDAKTISAFANKYKGKTIKFKGCIALMMKHENYKTRFDVAIANGDYKAKRVYGPLFSFIDVNYYDMNVSGSDSVAAGMNFTITGKIIGFNSEGNYIELEPVSLVKR